ncbi:MULTISPECIES: hypothetical protein [unclassified Chryseobacterium]|uniref:hypothetical protein n=1 Tax=unclassified Chryseobacterium TaxID=2593645 RepID=UPI002853693D|nr:hypothetical protein [Chryseobacterium sp. CFS7]MDR4892251.1 hypothetical protein [Chryseobacterium sp. CFS7]
MADKNKITLVLTKIELLALTDILDSFSALTDSIDDDGVSKKDLKKIDKMLLKNGWKREYS